MFAADYCEVLPQRGTATSTGGIAAQAALIKGGALAETHEDILQGIVPDEVEDPIVAVDIHDQLLRGWSGNT